MVDAVVVFTGGAERVETGLKLFKEGRGQKLLISGVGKGVRLNQIIDEISQQDAITLDHEATNTEQNVSETRAWVAKNDVKTLILVSAHYHLPRALLLLKQALPGVEIVPCPVWSKSFQNARWIVNPQILWKFIKEYHKFLLTMVQIYVLQRL